MRKLKQQVWPFQIKIMNNGPIKPIDDWCAENLGRRFNEWFSYDWEDKRVYAFKDEATLIVFKLRWSYNG